MRIDFLEKMVGTILSELESIGPGKILSTLLIIAITSGAIISFLIRLPMIGMFK